MATKTSLVSLRAVMVMESAPALGQIAAEGKKT
jgi:hypothetical protein